MSSFDFVYGDQLTIGLSLFHATILDYSSDAIVLLLLFFRFFYDIIKLFLFAFTFVALAPQVFFGKFLFITFPNAFPLGADLSLLPTAVCTLGFLTAIVLFILFIGILYPVGDFKFPLLATPALLTVSYKS